MESFLETYDSNNPDVHIAYANDSAMQKMTITDPEGNVIEEIKDWNGRITEIASYDNHAAKIGYSTTFTYDSLGNQIQVEKGQINGSVIRSQVYQYVYDDWNQLKQEIFPETEVIIPGTVTSVRLTPTISYEYDPLGRNIAVIDANGNATATIGDYRTEFVYDNSTNVVKMIQKSSAGDLVTKNYYDKLGRLIKTVNPESEVYQKVYHPQGWVIAEVNALGQAVYSQYNAVGLKIATTDPRGVKLTESTGGALKLGDKSYHVTLDSKYTTTFEYDSLSRQTKMTDALGTKTVVKYDRVGAKVEERFTPGAVYAETGEKITRYSYTPRGWVESITRGEGSSTNTIRYEYYANGLKWKEIYPEVQGMAVGSNCYEYIYDGRGQLKKAIGPDQSYEEYSYDLVGNRETLKNGRGYTTTYKYNGLQKLTEVQEPTNQTTKYFYDPNGNLVRVQQSNGLTTDYIYNDVNLLVKEVKTRAGDVMMYQNVYNKVGRQTVLVDPKGNITALEYDDAGMVKKEVHYAPSKEGVALPNLALVTTTQVPVGYAQESVISFAYDADGNLTDVTDRLGTQHFEMDELGRVKKDERRIDGKTYITNYTYDSASNVKGIIYPGSTKAEEITYGYNYLNQLESVSQFADDWKTNPTTKNFTYDPAGNLVQMRYNNGVMTHITPNTMSRPEKIVFQVPQSNTLVNALELQYLYDSNGNITNRNNNSYVYDELDRLKTATVEGKVTLEVSARVGYVSGDYTLTAAVNYALTGTQEVKFDYAAGTLGLQFGKESQVKRIDLVTSKQANHRVTKEGIRIFYKGFWETTFTEVASGEWDFAKDEKTGVIQLIFHSPIKATEMKIHSNYDDREITTGLLVDRSTFAKQLEKMVRIYDEIDQVKIGYEYDSVGNRTRETYTSLSSSNSITYTYNYYTGSDRLKTRTAGGKFTGGEIRSVQNGSPYYSHDHGAAYQYDKAGNVIAKGNSYTVLGTVSYTKTSGDHVAYWQYQYDAQNQLVRVSKNLQTIARYGYNYAGQRQKVVEGNGVTHYIYSLSGQVIQEVGYTTTSSDPFAATGDALVQGQVTSYVYANGRQIAKVEGPIGTGGRYYLHHDNLGSTVLVTQKDTNGAVVVYQQDYLPFGQSLSVSSATGANGAEPDFKFTGQHEDRDTGLYYYSARYYDPEIGRFTQEDSYFGSLALPGSQNLYVYTLNNPLKYVDPTGHTPEVANDSDWQLVWEFYSDFTETTDAIYINSKGEVLFSRSATDSNGTSITSRYYNKKGEFDHEVFKNFNKEGILQKTVGYDADKNANLPMEITSFALDWMPGVGDIKGIAEAIAGYEMAGNKLTFAERVLAMACLSELRGIGKVADYVKDSGKFSKSSNMIDGLLKQSQVVNTKTETQSMFKINIQLFGSNGGVLKLLKEGLSLLMYYWRLFPILVNTQKMQDGYRKI